VAHVEARFIPVRKQPVRKGGALVPNNLYRLQNRYEWPSGTGIDDRFSTSESSLSLNMWSTTVIGTTRREKNMVAESGRRTSLFFQFNELKHIRNFRETQQPGRW
jgi:hypothetical protein